MTVETNLVSVSLPEGLILDGENEKALKRREELQTILNGFRDINISAQEKKRKKQEEKRRKEREEKIQRMTKEKEEKIQRKQNLKRQEEKQEKGMLKKSFAQTFIRQSWIICGANGEQLAQLPPGRLKEVDEILAQKGKVIRSGILLSLWLLIPIIGWFVFARSLFDCGYMGLGTGYRFNLYRLRKRLKKLYGENYFPTEEIRSQLKEETQ